MKKKFSFIMMLIGMIGNLALTSCDKEEGDIYITNTDTTIINIYDTTIVNVTMHGDTVVIDNRFRIEGGDVTVGGDTISFYDVVNIEGDTINNTVTVTVEGDSIDNSSRSYSDPEIDVSGGTVNGTNVNTGGNSGDGGGDSDQGSEESAGDTYGTTVTEVKNGVLITVKDPRALSTNFQECLRKGCSVEEQFRMILGEFPRRDIRDIERENPGKLIVSVGYYDANVDPTTLAFSTKLSDENGQEVVEVKGKYGADIDREKILNALVWGQNYWEVLTVGYKDELHLPTSSPNYLVGFQGQFGKSKDDLTGRLLVSTNNKGELLILVLKKTTQTDAFHLIQEYGGRLTVTLNGGGSVQYANGNDDTSDDIVNHERPCPLYFVISR